MSVKLTQKIIAGFEPKAKTYTVWDFPLKGFYVKVSPTGNKVFCVSYIRPGGQRNTRKLGDCSILSVAVAREKAKAFLAGVTLGADPDREKAELLTLNDLIEKYYRPWFVANRKGGTTSVDLLQSYFDEFMDKRPSELSILDVEKWQRRKREEKGVKFSTLNRETTMLKSALNWAAKRGLITTNPLNSLKRLPETDSGGKTRYLSTEERTCLIEALNAREKEMQEARGRSLIHSNRQYLKSLEGLAFVDYLKPMVLVSLNTGMRRNALFSLRWDDIDFQAETILLRAEAAKSGKHTIIPMNTVTRETLSAWQKQTGRDSGLVFVNPLTGKKFDNCKKAWGSLLNDAKIKNFRWHDMRHDFASRLVMKGVDLNTVRELLGHSDIKMTMRYAHLAPEKKRKAVDMLD